MNEHQFLSVNHTCTSNSSCRDAMLYFSQDFQLALGAGQTYVPGFHLGFFVWGGEIVYED